MNIEELGKKIIESAVEVHSQLGPGLLESSYERCLVHELVLRGINFERQKRQPIQYKGIELDEGYRVDLLVEKQIIVELKAADFIKDLHVAQLFTYLRHSGCKLGYLLNFNVAVMTDGIKRIVNELPQAPSKRV